VCAIVNCTVCELIVCSHGSVRVQQIRSPIQTSSIVTPSSDNTMTLALRITIGAAKCYISLKKISVDEINIRNGLTSKPLDPLQKLL
jgi:hypothetical protein